jgi:hypothetical protein
MGLLDEAIREHLELKRRRGGDAREIAREEEEVLRPLDFSEVPSWAQGPAELEPHEPAAAPWGEALNEPAVAEGPGPAPFDGDFDLEEAALAQGPPERAGGQLEQETVEVDMAAMIAESDPVAGEAPAAGGGPITARRITSSPDGPPQLGEDFEWIQASRQRPEAVSEESSPQGSFALE